MTTAAVPDAAPADRPGYDPDGEATARRVQSTLAEERVAWLSTVGPDGAPHLVPTWFWWDGEALLFWSKPDAVKVRNIRANPRLMVALGDAHADFSVALIEASATPVDVQVPDAFFAKYGADLAAGRLDRATYRALYTQAVRVVPTRFLAWHGRGARHDAVRPAPVAGSGTTAGVAVAASLAPSVSRARPQRPLATLAGRLALLLEGAAGRLHAASADWSAVAA